MVYNDEPFHDRISRAADAGVDAVEFWDWREKDLDAITAAADEADLPIVGCTAGGVLTDPNKTDEAVKTLRESIEAAAELGSPSLIATTGPDQNGLDRSTQHDAIVEALSAIVPDAKAAGVTVVLEPLNTAVDHPDCYLSSSHQGYEIIDAVGSNNVKLLFDIYHQQITEGNIIQNVTENIDHIGHFHVADVPGRHELGTGELNYENIFAAIDEAGYDGYVGLEFSPTGNADEAIATLVDRNADTG